MISESRYWKEPLLKISKRLSVCQKRFTLSERQIAQLERDVFIGFYSVRKLLDAPAKLSDRIRAMKIELVHYQNREPVTWLTKDKIDELYDLQTGHQENRDLRFVCGRLIHSYVFLPVFNETGLEGVFFTSDIDKNDRLYFLRTEEIIRVLKSVGSNYPKEVQWNIDESHRETWEIT